MMGHSRDGGLAPHRTGVWCRYALHAGALYTPTTIVGATARAAWAAAEREKGRARRRPPPHLHTYHYHLRMRDAALPPRRTPLPTPTRCTLRVRACRRDTCLHGMCSYMDRCATGTLYQVMSVSYSTFFSRSSCKCHSILHSFNMHRVAVRGAVCCIASPATPSAARFLVTAYARRCLTLPRRHIANMRTYAAQHHAWPAVPNGITRPASTPCQLLAILPFYLQTWTVRL